MEKRKHTKEWMQYGVYLYDMKIPGMDLHRFHKLGKIVKVALTIPHSVSFLLSTKSNEMTEESYSYKVHFHHYYM